MADIWGGILAGGPSQRMGKPLHLQVHAGRSFTRIVVDALVPSCAGLAMLGQTTLPGDVMEMTCLQDTPGAFGPMGGIAAALQFQSKATWMITACNMPLLSPGAIRWLLHEHEESGALATIPLLDGEPLPTCAVYGPTMIRSLQSFAQTRRDLSDVVHLKGVYTPNIPHPEPFRSVNTREQLAGLVQAAFS